MFLRIYAMGFYDPEDDTTYWADPWNRLDCVLTITGWLGFFIPLKLSVLRVVRLLRLQKLEAFKGIRDIVSAIANSIPSLLDVCFLLLFSFTIYGIIGVSLFMGDMQNRCFISEEVMDAETNLTVTVATETMSNPELWCAMPDADKPDALPCPANMICAWAGNPNDGTQSFDNIGDAFLSIFVASTMEGWTDMMYGLMRSSNGTAAWVYFVTLLLFITFIVLNLFVAVVCTEYGKLREPDDLDEIAEPYDADFDPNRYRIEMEDGNWVRVRDNNTMMMRNVNREQPSIGQRLQYLCKDIMEDERFDDFLLSMILLNTVFLAMPYYGMPLWYSNLLLYMEDVFNIVFTFEVIIKVIGMRGFINYLQDNQNKFDFVIVMISLPDLFRLPVPSFSLFRAVRLMRLVRLLKSNVELLRLIEAVFGSIPAMGNLMVMIGFTQLLFCLFGMQIFGGTVDEEDLRSNFDSFWQSNLTLFQCLSGENWTDVLYAYMIPYPAFSPVYFIAWTVFGNYVLLNLFVAVITENIEMDDSERGIKQQKEHERETREQRMVDGTLALSGSIGDDDDAELNESVEKAARFTKHQRLVVASLPVTYVPEVGIDVITLMLDRKTKAIDMDIPWNYGAGGAVPLYHNDLVDTSMAADMPGEKAVPEDVFADNGTAAEFALRFRQGHHLGPPGRVDRALDPEDHGPNQEEAVTAVTIRPKCSCSGAFFVYWIKEMQMQLRSLVSNPYFDNSILFIIMMSSVALAIENPYNTDTTKLVLFVGDYIWLIVFSVEFLAKSTAHGIKEYIKDDWNRLDCLVLFFTYFSMFGPSDGAAGIGRIFRIGRTLRPLRMINRNPEMKLIINSIIRSLPAVSNALILACFAFFVFAVFGLNLFMGLLYTCNDGESGEADCNGNAELETEGEDEYLMPLVWSTQRNHFDNIIQALMTLFEAATTEGWVDLMYATMDIDGEGLPPKYNNHKEYALYWVMFIFVCTFFIVQLFVGVIIDNYNREMNILTEEQKRWVLLKRVMMNMGPDQLVRPDNQVRLMVYKMVRSNVFDQAIITLVILNTLFMALQHWDEPKKLTDVLTIANLFFIVAFVAEMLLKLFAFGFFQYVNDSWNCFDAIIVIGSCITMWFDAGAIAQVGRVFRIARLLKIVKRAKGLKTLFNTMLTSLPSMANISALMFLLYFVYAIIGITLFGTTRYRSFYTNDANFRNFPNALLLLFRMSTGENWHEVMGDCQVEPPECQAWGGRDGGGDCGMDVVSPVYYMSFFSFGVYLMLNLFIAVILDNFANCYNKEANLVTTEHLEQYRAVWRKFDIYGAGSIPFRDLRQLIGRLGKLDNPLVRGINGNRVLYGLIHSDMRNLAEQQRKKGDDYFDPERDGLVDFNKLVESLCVLQMEIEMEGTYLTPDERTMMEEKQRKLKRDVAASVIGSAIRGFLARKRYEKKRKQIAEAEQRNNYLSGAEGSPSPRSSSRKSPRSPRSRTGTPTILGVSEPSPDSSRRESSEPVKGEELGFFTGNRKSP